MPTTWVWVRALKDYNRAPNRCNGFVENNYCRNESEIIYGSAEVDRGGGSKCRVFARITLMLVETQIHVLTTRL